MTTIAAKALAINTKKKSRIPFSAAEGRSHQSLILFNTPTNNISLSDLLLEDKPI